MVKKEETKVNKITDEQLKDVTAKQAQINDAIHRIGMFEVQKEGVKRMLEDVSKEMEEMKKALEEEYGQININLQNGEYTPIEKEEVVEDKESDK